jgi:hypothetical protein
MRRGEHELTYADTVMRLDFLDSLIQGTRSQNK